MLPYEGRGRMGRLDGKRSEAVEQLQGGPAKAGRLWIAPRGSPGLGINGWPWESLYFSVMGWSHDLGSNKQGPEVAVPGGCCQLSEMHLTPLRHNRIPKSDAYLKNM